MSPILSWLVVCAVLLLALAIAAAAILFRPVPHVELLPELRGPARDSSWTLAEMFELAAMVAGLVVAVFLACGLGPTLDRHDAERTASAGK